MALVNISDPGTVIFCELPKRPGSSYPELSGRIDVAGGVITRIILVADAGTSYGPAVAWTGMNIDYRPDPNGPSHIFTLKMNGTIIDQGDADQFSTKTTPAKRTVTNPGISIPTTPFSLSLSCVSTAVVEYNDGTGWSYNSSIDFHNVSCSGTDTYMQDVTPPTISNFIVNSTTTPVGGQNFFVDYPNTTCDFEFTVTDNQSGLKSYKATNASGVDTTGSLSGTSQTITLSHDLNEINSSNEIKYELEVEDIAGNISTQSSPIVIVDNTPPTGTLAIDSSQTKNVVDGVTYIKTSDVKLSIAKSDSESGLF